MRTVRFRELQAVHEQLFLVWAGLGENVPRGRYDAAHTVRTQIAIRSAGSRIRVNHVNIVFHCTRLDLGPIHGQSRRIVEWNGGVV